MLKRGSIVLSIWSGINFLLAALILTTIVIFNAPRPHNPDHYRARPGK